MSAPGGGSGGASGWKVTFHSDDRPLCGVPESGAESGGPAACGPTGRYTFKLSGSTLKFKNKGDTTIACSGRAVVLSRTFTKA